MKKQTSSAPRHTAKKTSAKKRKAVITHFHITRVMYISLVAFLLCAASVLFIYSNAEKAQATEGMIPFGGPIIMAVPVNPFPLLPCPPHTVISNLAASTYMAQFGIIVPPIVGVYTIPPYSNIFEDYNLITPGVQTLGEYIPFPFPTCAVPYPVYLGTFNPPYLRYNIGTGLIPGT